MESFVQLISGDTTFNLQPSLTPEESAIQLELQGHEEYIWLRARSWSGVAVQELLNIRADARRKAIVELGKR